MYVWLQIEGATRCLIINLKEMLIVLKEKNKYVKLFMWTFQWLFHLSDSIQVVNILQIEDLLCLLKRHASEAGCTGRPRAILTGLLCCPPSSHRGCGKSERSVRGSMMWGKLVCWCAWCKHTAAYKFILMKYEVRLTLVFLSQGLSECPGHCLYPHHYQLR